MYLECEIQTKPEVKLQQGRSLLLLTEALTGFCCVDHKLADALKLVAKIVFYGNTI